MPCGVTKTLSNGTVVTCDNAGTSAHSGQHSGPLNFFGTNIRVFWTSTATEQTVAGYKRPLVGVRARDGQQWLSGTTTATLTAAGMDKSGSWAFPTSWGRPPLWTPRSGFTGVEIENDALVMNADGNIRIYYRAGHQNTSGFGYTLSKRVVKNGTVLHSSTTIDTVHTVDTSVVTGDMIWMDVMASFPFGGSSTLAAGSANTYLYTAVL